MADGLRFQDVHAYYGDAHVLQGVTLAVPPGKVVALLGRNGAGKTTTIHASMGFVKVRGSISFNGVEIANLSPHKIARLGLGLVPQGRRIFPTLSVRENITTTARGSSGWELEHIYQLFPVLRERTEQLGSRLSGGEQQMLSIARALATNPTLLLLDEPSEGLAPILVQTLRDVLVKLKRENFGILLVEQNIGLALSVADYVYIMKRGQIQWSGATTSLSRTELEQQLGI